MASRLGGSVLLAFVLLPCGCRLVFKNEPPAAAPRPIPTPVSEPAKPPPPPEASGPKVSFEIPMQLAIDSALREIGRRIDRVLVADGALRQAANAGEIGIWLRVRDFPRDEVPAWFARGLRAYAVPRPDNHVLLTRRDDWMRQEELKPRVVADIGGLYTESDGRDLTDALEAALYPVTRMRSEAKIAFEPARRVLVLNLPDCAQSRLDRVLRVLREPEAALPAASEPAIPDVQVSAMDLKDATLPEALDRLAAASGVNLGSELDNPAKHSLSIPAGSLSSALQDIARAFDLDAPRAVPGQGVWVGRKPRENDPPVGGWHPYLRAEVRAYSLVGITGPRGVGGIELNVLLHTTATLIRTLSPGPAPEALPSGGISFGSGRCFFLHRKTWRLVVIHDPEVQRAVAAHLARLEKEGAKRLYGEPGPAKTP
ncbi:MAG: hypothetical protein AAB215_05465 [Planctomycetota bacterium]